MSKQYWWKDRAWRIVQTNLREIDMADMNAEQYVRELQEFNANTVIINTGGIAASYESNRCLFLSLLTVLSCNIEVEYAQRLVNIILASLKQTKNYQKSKKTHSRGKAERV